MYLSSKNFKPHGLDLSKVEFISETDYQRHFKEHSKAITKPMLGDVLVGIIGSLGEPYVIRESDRFGLSSSVAILRPNKNLLLPKYLYYWMRGAKFQSAVYGIKGGVAQSYLSLEMIRSLPVELPILAVQRRIVDILSVYDDLIENNTLRIKTLEQMAQLLYREWFVNFRFSGHEKFKMVESKIGVIPHSWSVVALSSILDNIKESTVPGEHLDSLQYLPIDCLQRKCLAVKESRPISEAQSSLLRFREADFLFGSMRSYFHKVAVAPFDGVTRSTCFVLRPRHESFYSWAALTLFDEDTVAYSHQQARGSTIPYAVWDGSLGDMLVALPPISLLEKFETCVRPMLRRISLYYFQHNALVRARDLLLPKLVSGEVNVEQIEQEVLAEVV
jgi:type I restriction enzyme S subunit